ncbi:hypothetical protein WG66_005757 [Moniliophthora roreri]|nr:hypothetical protein WG66_005757 [Moniliophthora roreri]
MAVRRCCLTVGGNDFNGRSYTSTFEELRGRNANPPLFILTFSHGIPWGHSNLTEDVPSGNRNQLYFSSSLSQSAAPLSAVATFLTYRWPSSKPLFPFATQEILIGSRNSSCLYRSQTVMNEQQNSSAPVNRRAIIPLHVVIAGKRVILVNGVPNRGHVATDCDKWDLTSERIEEMIKFFQQARTTHHPTGLHRLR